LRPVCAEFRAHLVVSREQACEGSPVSCCAAGLLVWAATSRETIDNVWWPTVRAVGRTLGPVFGGAFALAAAVLGVALLFAAPYVVIAVALVWLVWHVLRR